MRPATTPKKDRNYYKIDPPILAEAPLGTGLMCVPSRQEIIGVDEDEPTMVQITDGRDIKRWPLHALTFRKGNKRALDVHLQEMATKLTAERVKQASSPPPTEPLQD